MSPDSDSTRLPNPNLCAEQREGRSPEPAAGAFSRRRFIAEANGVKLAGS